MTAQPKTKVVELVERLNNLGLSTDRPELVLRQLRRDIESTAQLDHARGFDLYGMLAALLEDVEETRRCYEAALRLEPRNIEILLNYSTSLARLGFFTEATQTVKRAHDQAPGDLEVLDNLISQYVVDCRYTEAASMLEKWENLADTREYPSANEIRSTKTFLESSGVTDNDGEAMLNLASEVLHEANVFDVNSGSELVADEESQWLNVNIRVQRPVEIVVHLNEKLAEREADMNFSSEALLSICVIFLTANNDAGHAN